MCILKHNQNTFCRQSQSALFNFQGTVLHRERGGLFFKANDNARAFETFTDIICTLAACLTAAIITLCVSLQLRHEQLKPPFPRSTGCSKSVVTKILHWTIFKYSNIQHILKTWSNTLLKFSVQIVKPWVASKRQKDLPPPLKLLSNYNVPSSIGRRFYCATKRRILQTCKIHLQLAICLLQAIRDKNGLIFTTNAWSF